MRVFHQSVFERWPFEDGSIQAIITSPPYYSLRKYNIPDVIIGGGKDCEHEWNIINQPARGGHSHPDRPPSVGANRSEMEEGISIKFGYQSKFCIHCHAWKGQYGLEPKALGDPNSYVEHTRLWAKEAWRVLKDNGVFFLNLSDSYSSGGVQHGRQNDTDDKELQDLKGDDVFLKNPCDECVKIYPNHNLDKDKNLVQEPVSLSEQSIHSHKGQQIDHLNNLDLTSPLIHTEGELSGLYCEEDSFASDVLVSQESTKPESSLQFQGDNLQKDNSFSSPSSEQKQIDTMPLCEDKKVSPSSPEKYIDGGLDSVKPESNNLYNPLIAGASAPRKRGKVCGSCPYRYSKTIRHQKSSYKHKCQLLIPHRVAIALVDDGWILRNTIIWNKPNAMPESVTDRFSKKYEYIFMFVKQQKYYFDLDAVREKHKEVSIQRLRRAVSNKHKYSDGVEGQGRQGLFKPRLNINYKGGGNKGREQNMGIATYEFEGGDYMVANLNPNGKNPGDVWEIPTQPSPEKHYAMWPEKLVERMILCSTKAGDTVLDPFCGSGTTLRVADRLNRIGCGIDLGYKDIQERRLKEIQKVLI